MAAKQTTACRILSACQLDGVKYQPNQVVEFPSAMLKALEEQGVVDSSNGAVAYCLKELGVVAVVHAAAEDDAEA